MFPLMPATFVNAQQETGLGGMSGVGLVSPPPPPSHLDDAESSSDTDPNQKCAPSTVDLEFHTVFHPGCRLAAVSGWSTIWHVQ